MNYWKLAGANSMIVLSFNDLRLPLNSLLTVFKFAVASNLAIVQNNLKINFEGIALKDTLVNAIACHNWELYYTNDRNKLISKLLPVTNFEDKM